MSFGLIDHEAFRREKESRSYTVFCKIPACPCAVKVNLYTYQKILAGDKEARVYCDWHLTTPPSGVAGRSRVKEPSPWGENCVRAREGD